MIKIIIKKTLKLVYNTNITAAVVVTIMTVSNLFSPSHSPIHIAKLLLPYIRVSACIYTHTHTHVVEVQYRSKVWAGNNLSAFSIKPPAGDVLYTYIYIYTQSHI